MILIGAFNNNKATIMQHNLNSILFSLEKHVGIIITLTVKIILLNNNLYFHLQVLHTICASYLDRELYSKHQTRAHKNIYTYITSTMHTNTHIYIYSVNHFFLTSSGFFKDMLHLNHSVKHMVQSIRFFSFILPTIL